MAPRTRTLLGVLAALCVLVGAGTPPAAATGPSLHGVVLHALVHDSDVAVAAPAPRVLSPQGPAAQPAVVPSSSGLPAHDSRADTDQQPGLPLGTRLLPGLGDRAPPAVS